LIVDIAKLDHAIIVQFSGVARSWHLNMPQGRRNTL